MTGRRQVAWLLLIFLVLFVAPVAYAFMTPDLGVALR